MPRDLVDQALAQLEAEGQILRGRFTPDRREELEWCHRRLLARIHRLTIGRLRREIEPVTTAAFFAFPESLAAPGPVRSCTAWTARCRSSGSAGLRIRRRGVGI
jgi:hypothetical protein